MAPVRTSGRCIETIGISEGAGRVSAALTVPLSHCPVRAIAINRRALPGPVMTGGARNFATNLSLLPLSSLSPRLLVRFMGVVADRFTARDQRPRKTIYGS